MAPKKTTDIKWKDTVDPTVNEDSSNGFFVGHEWHNTTTDSLFEIFDDSVGAAVWREKSAGSGLILDGPFVFLPEAIIQTPVLAADQDDFDFTGFQVGGVIQVTLIEIDSSTDIDFSGVKASSPDIANMIWLLNKSSSDDHKYIHNSGLSLVGNRMILQDNGDVVIKPGAALQLYRQVADTKWKQLNSIP